MYSHIYRQISGPCCSGNFNWATLITNTIHQALSVYSCVPQTLFGKTYWGIISFAWLEISSLLMFLLCNSSFCKLRPRLLQRRAPNSTQTSGMCGANGRTSTHAHPARCELPLFPLLSCVFMHLLFSVFL